MGDEKKKITFSFSKVIKKPAVAPSTAVAPKTDNNIQFIDCVEENSIKVIGVDSNAKPKELIIPMKDDNLLRNNLLATLRSRTATSAEPDLNGKAEINKEEGVEEQEKKPLTLDEMAAKEIMEDLKKQQEVFDKHKILTLPLTETISGQKESTLDDYDNVPISDFGMAMLRGMGWKPDEGIGKNCKVIRPTSPTLRPKGMGLGADKVLKKNIPVNSIEEIVLKIGTCIKVLQGQYKHLYGKVEGFEEVSGRLIVRLTISNSLVTLSEFMVEGVKLEEYNKNSKVLNVTKYNEYKDKEGDNKQDTTADKTEERNRGEDVKSGIRNSKPFHKDERENKRYNDDNCRPSKKDNTVSKIHTETKSRSSKKYDSPDSSDHSLQEYNSKSSSDRHKRSSPDIKSKSRRGRSRSSNSSNSSYNDYKKRSNKHKKHKVSRKHKSRSRSRSRHDKFKRKHRHKSPGRRK